MLVLARYIGPSRAIAFLIWILGAPARATHADPSGAKLLAAQFATVATHYANKSKIGLPLSATVNGRNVGDIVFFSKSIPRA